jgi:teichuronic acid biosynthesis glycosyltransferase TuaC
VNAPSQVVLDGANSLNILFVTNMYPGPGCPSAGTFVQHQADYLRKAGHRVDILNIGERRSPLKYFRSIFDVLSRTRTYVYDVVHAHYGLSGVPALFRSHAPLVITLHGSDALVGRMQPLISKTVCSLADAVIVVSKGIARKIKGEIIPCGIDMEIFHPRDRAAARTRLGLPQKAKLVLFPFDPRRKIKRFDLAKAAVEHLGDPSIQILTVDGKPNTEMPWYYSAADVIVLSSKSEGSPTSVKEALSCDLPVVSTDVGDVREIVDGIEGCEICDGSAQSLGEGLRRVLDRGRNHPFAARQSMLRYDERNVVSAIIRVYERAIHARLSGEHRTAA